VFARGDLEKLLVDRGDVLAGRVLGNQAAPRGVENGGLLRGQDRGQDDVAVRVLGSGAA
jgi:hypothetical protein